MPYNLTYVANSTTVLVFVQRLNTELVSGYLGLLILIAVGVILITSFKFATNDMKKSIAATSFILMVIGLLLRAMDLINSLHLFVLVIACAAALAFTWR